MHGFLCAIERTRAYHRQKNFPKLLKAKLRARLNSCPSPHQVAKIRGRLNFKPAQIVDRYPRVAARDKNFEIGTNAWV